MGLLSTEVEIGCYSGAKYYESLGYKFPRRFDKYGKYCISSSAKIKVKVSDLKEGSHVLVKVECDKCNKQFDLKYCRYISAIKGSIANGKYFCPNCISELNRGERHHAWNPILTKEERENGRKFDGYLDFIKSVLERDDYICQVCGKSHSGKMVVHHLNGYNWCIEGRIDPSNAICMCENCHENFHSVYGKGDNTKEQFEEWLGYALGELTKYNGILPRARQVYCFEDNIVFSSVKDASEKLKINNSSIYSVCNRKIQEKSHTRNGKITTYMSRSITAKGKHFIWYDIYNNMSEIEKKEYLESGINSRIKPIFCLTTNMKFNCIKDAAEFYNITTRTHISACCRGQRKTCGQLPDGTRLQWMYYDDYLNNMNSNLKEAS